MKRLSATPTKLAIGHHAATLAAARYRRALVMASSFALAIVALVLLGLVVSPAAAGLGLVGIVVLVGLLVVTSR